MWSEECLVRVWVVGEGYLCYWLGYIVMCAVGTAMGSVSVRVAGGTRSSVKCGKNSSALDCSSCLFRRIYHVFIAG